MRTKRRLTLALCFLALFIQPIVSADKVVPSDRVTNSIPVRESPSGSSSELARLPVGASADLITSVPSWHKVRMADGTEGFVSKAWSKVVPDAASSVQFQIYFLDVGTGDATIIDMGDKEIVIDGGDSVSILNDYAKATGIIDGPIELAVVTHGDTDHWRGFNRILGFDNNPNAQVHNVLEFWEPGYNRACGPLPNYDKFITNMRNIPGIRFFRPLEQTHRPAVKSGQLDTITFPSLPGVKINVLHTDSNPTGGDCAYIINNASIVLKIEIGVFKFLFTGDANGKERDESSPGTPGHVEAKLLAFEATHPGTLKADVLKVPHHGSETASTQAFINAVNPQFAIISASTKHHLPKATTVSRYENNSQRVALRTDDHTESGVDHIICFKDADGKLDCNYESVIEQ
jgi:beta-lactamase superfamily II metal-dependent hydrolase